MEGPWHLACTATTVRIGLLAPLLERNGYHCEDVDEMVHALDRIGRIDRSACRREFEERFTARRMALDYLRVYAGVAGTAVAEAEAAEPGEPTELGRPR